MKCHSNQSRLGEQDIQRRKRILPFLTDAATSLPQKRDKLLNRRSTIYYDKLIS